MNILGMFPLAPGQLKFLIGGLDYFNKWIEAEAVPKITTERVWNFYGRGLSVDANSMVPLSLTMGPNSLAVVIDF